MGKPKPTAGASLLIRATVRKMATRELALCLNLNTANPDPARAIILDAMRAELARRNQAREHGPTQEFLPAITRWAADHPGYTEQDAQRFAIRTALEG